MFTPAPELAVRFRHDLAAVAGESGDFAIALSGGVDSLALLLLAQAVAPGRVRAATVDHGLRPESAAEAALAASACARLGVSHRILAVSVAREGSGLQAAARKARYAALAGWMKEGGLGTLLTAHHADDQAETLLMRLLRGSGIGGLAGIRASLPFPAAGPGARICRPLLAWRRSALEEIVREAGMEPVADPSNEDEAYDRARLRHLMRGLDWLDVPAFSRSAAALAEAEEALEATADRLFDERTRRKSGAVTLDAAGVPPELLRRLVRRCLSAAAPGAAPRGEQVTSLIERLRKGRTATLAGVKCTGGERFRFERARPRQL